MLFLCIVKAHIIRHVSCQHAFFSTCIINLILNKEYAGLRVKEGLAQVQSELLKQRKVITLVLMG